MTILHTLNSRVPFKIDPRVVSFLHSFCTWTSLEKSRTGQPMNSNARDDDGGDGGRVTPKRQTCHYLLKLCSLPSC